jgi:2-polyprenyl-3-methyl-5-hydroxy-6-metoxy-1,4-benzoquinol methylase
MDNQNNNHRHKNDKANSEMEIDSTVKNNARESKEESWSEAENHLEKREFLYARFGYDLERERQAVVKAAKPFSGRILDAGTGKGHFALALARSGYRVVSFDLSEDQLKVARENLEKNGVSHLVELRQEDGEKLSFPDGSFDTIFSVNMVHHLKNPCQVISELTRVLSPAGKLVICDFSPEGMAMMAEVHKLEGDSHEESPVGLAEVGEFLKKAGFKIQKSRAKYEITLVAQRVTMK